MIDDESLRGPEGGHQESGHGRRSNALVKQCVFVSVSAII